MTVAGICRALGMSRQNYYKSRRCRERRRLDEEGALELVKSERARHERMGTRKLLVKIGPELGAMGVTLGRDRLFEMLRREGLLVRRKAARPRTTRVDWRYRVEPNRLKDLEVSRPHQAWVGDLTYVRTRAGWRYVSLLTDAHSRKIVGHALWKALTVEGPLEALRMALKQLPDGGRPLHHTDRGCQYTSTPYRERLRQAGLGVSMTQEDHCDENAMAERVNGILKQEYGLDREFVDDAQARLALAQAVSLYNTERPHVSLGYRTPEAVHRAA